MRVAEKTDSGPLIGKTRDSVEVIENVAPLPRSIERGMYNREIMDSSLQRQRPQPIPVLLIQTFAGPLNGAFGELVETFR